MTKQLDERLDELLDKYIYCDSGCGINASDALGYDVSCTCGAEKDAQTIKTLISEEVDKARIEEIDILRNGYDWGDALETSEYILDDRLATLQEQSEESI